MVRCRARAASSSAGAAATEEDEASAAPLFLSLRGRGPRDGEGLAFAAERAEASSGTAGGKGQTVLAIRESETAASAGPRKEGGSCRRRWRDRRTCRGSRRTLPSGRSADEAGRARRGRERVLVGRCRPPVRWEARSAAAGRASTAEAARCPLRDAVLRGGDRGDDVGATSASTRPPDIARPRRWQDAGGPPAATTGGRRRRRRRGGRPPVADAACDACLRCRGHSQRKARAIRSGGSLAAPPAAPTTPAGLRPA